MKDREEVNRIIDALVSEGFWVECPCCGEPVRLSEAGLFYLDDFTPEALEIYKNEQSALKERGKELRRSRRDIKVRSETGAKATNIGFLLERLAPSMKGFAFNRNDCRSLFDPIDYIIFEGLSKKNSVSRIIFADIKTGGAQLAKKQKAIKELVGKKKVQWDIYNPK